MTLNTKQASFTLPLSSLQKALAAVTPALQRKSSTPALGAVRIEPHEDAVEFSGTNLELSIRVRSKAPGALAGEPMLLPGHKLEGYARLLQGEAVSLAKLDSRRAAIECGGARTKFATIPMSDFPCPYMVPAPSERSVFLQQSVVERMLRFTTFAAGHDDKRGMAGALLEVSAGKVQMVTTDGARLARYAVPTEAADLNIVLPDALLGAMSRTVNGGTGGTCSLVATDGFVYACAEDSAGSVDLAHRFTSAQFPHYKQIIPTKAEASVRLPAELVVMAVKRCMSMTDQGSQAVTLAVSPSELKLSAAESSTGETVDVLRAHSPNQFPALSAMFRGSYLLDALTRVRGEVELAFARVGQATGLWIVHTLVVGETFEYVLVGLKR